MNDNIRLRSFIIDNKALFWYINPEKLNEISLSFLTETILNYGDLKTVKELFNIVGTKNVAESFFHSLEKERNNYFPDVTNYFSLNNSRIPIMTSPPTPLQTERGAGFVRAKSPSPVWERDLG